jgi:hypothetical protein
MFYVMRNESKTERSALKMALRVAKTMQDKYFMRGNLKGVRLYEIQINHILKQLGYA